MIYEIIYEKYYRVLVNYAFRRLKDKFYSEEIANETFALLWERWSSMSFDSENAVLKWLYQVAEYKMMAHKRKKSNDYIPINSITIHNNVSINNEEIDPVQEEYKYLQYLSEVRKELNSKDLLLFDKIVIQKLQYKQIATELSTTVPAVKMRWLRLKTRLRQIVKKITGE